MCYYHLFFRKICTFAPKYLRTKNKIIMRVIIQSDYQKMSQWAANHVIESINKFNPTPQVRTWSSYRLISRWNVQLSRRGEPCRKSIV